MVTLSQQKRASARLYTGNAPTFHPKVLLVSHPEGRFALVGSANLSEGGFRQNVECSVFLEDQHLLDSLRSWFDGIFEDNDKAKDLKPRDILEYEALWEKAKSRLEFLRNSEKSILSAIAESPAKKVKHLTKKDRMDAGVMSEVVPFAKTEIHKLSNPKGIWVTREELAAQVSKQRWAILQMRNEGVNDPYIRLKRFGNWIDFFSKNYREERHDLEKEFERTRLDDKWAYRPPLAKNQERSENPKIRDSHSNSPM